MARLAECRVAGFSAQHDIVSAASEVVRAFAPAKVNLWLDVHGRRADGYHDLSTLMLALDWGDELTASRARAPGIALTLSGSALTKDIPADERNLIWRAATLASERAHQIGLSDSTGLRLELIKHVPSQAGLGGGSSDAVTALLLVERLLGLDLGREWRQATCAGLGADCSFFLERGTSGLAQCEGVGEIVRPWNGPAPNWWLVILVPGFGCPTAQVFGALASDRDLATRRREPQSANSLQQLSIEELRGLLYTDLEAAALRAVPALRPFRALLDAAGAAHYRLSGSGSSFFGLYSDASAAQADLQRLRAACAAADLPLRNARLARPWTTSAPPSGVPKGLRRGGQ